MLEIILKRKSINCSDMKIYEVSYIGMDDNSYREYFTVKSEADSRFKKLKKKEDKILDDDAENNPAGCKQVFDVKPIDCEISKQGIINMLNTHFREFGGY